MGREFSQEDDSDENSDEAPGCQPLMKSISGILQSPAFRSLAMNQWPRYHLAMAVACGNIQHDQRPVHRRQPPNAVGISGFHLSNISS